MSSRIKRKNRNPLQKTEKLRFYDRYNVNNALNMALGFYSSGQMKQSEDLCGQILMIEPNNAVALQLLGMIYHHSGKIEIGSEFIKKAIKIDPTSPEIHYNYGIILQSQGKTDEAISSFRKAIKLNPDFAKAYNNLGDALQSQGNCNEAISAFHKALVLAPNFVEVYNNLGVALQSQGKTNEAISYYKIALKLRPVYEEAYNNLGMAFQSIGNASEAVINYKQALALNCHNPVVYNNMGISLQTLGNITEAVACYQQAVVLDPEYADAHNNLGNVFFDQGKTDEAIECYRKALAFKHDYAVAYYNLGNAHESYGKFDEAIVNYKSAINWKPDYVEAYNNLAILLKNKGKIDEAISCYRQALSLNNTDLFVHSNLLLCLNYSSDLSSDEYLSEAIKYNTKVHQRVNDPFLSWQCSGNPDRLRVGLVSGDLRNHPVGFFLESVVSSINRRRIELIAFQTFHKEDDLTVRLRPYFSGWHSIVGLSDEVAARLIHDNGLHILIDLSGHTNHNRLPVFAWKPAPVQVSWLGYCASTGLTEMDYLLVDPVSVPEDHQEQFTERVWYLPETRLCFSPPVVGEEMPLTSLPALHNGHITFGCFQNLAKINDEVLAVWGRIFQALPQAKLRLQNKQFSCPATVEQLQRRLAINGIAPEKVAMVSSVPRAEYLASHDKIDIILDTFPFSGGTTTCEALWMGVPTVTLAGNTMIGRQGASLLSNAGLTDWVAVDAEDYVVKTVTHATDLAKLARLRAGLRGRVMASPLFDGPRFARHLEAALWGIWDRFLAEQQKR